MPTYKFIGNDCPPGYRWVGTIDVADPADVHRAQDRGYRIGPLYDGQSGSCAEPCAADIYERPDESCGLADPSASDCFNMKEVGGGMDGERYRCAVCGKSYFLDYEEMK